MELATKYQFAVRLRQADGAEQLTRPYDTPKPMTAAWSRAFLDRSAGVVEHVRREITGDGFGEWQVVPDEDNARYRQDWQRRFDESIANAAEHSRLNFEKAPDQWRARAGRRRG